MIQTLAPRGFVWVTRGPSARCVASPNMAADLTLRDLCASAVSVALRDQYSINPSIAASDLPLNRSLIDGRPADLITQRSQRRRARRGIVRNV